MSLVSKIQELVDQEGDLTLIGLERELGFGRGTIRNWDTNSPSASKLSKVAKRLNVTMDYLLSEKDEEEIRPSLPKLATLILYKNTDKPEPYKSATLPLSTHEKLIELQKSCGLPIPKLLTICVDFTLDRAAISVEESPGFKVIRDVT